MNYWTGKRDKILRDLTAKGVSPGEMARMFGVGVRAVEARLRQIAVQKADSKRTTSKPSFNDEQMAVRSCLTCRRDFVSDHRGNRRCGDCRQSRVYKSEPFGAHTL